MDLSQIQYVLALSEELHFTRAARRCGVAQPSLTNAIRKLEDELGGMLFLRRPAVQLSPLGAALRPHFERILTEVETAQDKAAHHWRSAAATSRPAAPSSPRRRPYAGAPQDGA